jgi:hypothetical protein
VSPYLRFPGVHENIAGPNGQEPGFSASPGDMLSHFRFGLMGVVEPRYKRIKMPLDIMWIRLGSDKALPNTPGQGVANLRATEFILTQNLGYRLFDSEKIKIDALAGFRYWHFGENLSLYHQHSEFFRVAELGGPAGRQTHQKLALALKPVTAISTSTNGARPALIWTPRHLGCSLA